MVVGFVHVGKPRAGGEIRSIEWVFGEKIDVILYNHKVANGKCRIHSAGGIAYKQRLDTQFIHHTFGKRHLFHRVSLVKMKTTLHRHDVLSTQLAEDQLSRMAFNSRHREVGNILI